MATLDLNPVREVLHARRVLHGGNPGAPRLTAAQVREGAALNRAAMVTLAASLEAYVEEVFQSCVRERYDRFGEADIERVLKQLPRLRTTSPSKIGSAFLVLGVSDVLDGLRWRNCNNMAVREKLDRINQIRNKCAHGQRVEITIENQRRTVNLTVPIVEGFINYAQAFGSRFEQHARSALP